MGSAQVKKNVYFIAVGQIAQKMLGFILIPFAARYLGDQGFGKFSLASTIMFLVLLFNDLGINTYLTREIAKNRRSAEQYFFQALSLKFILIVFDFLLLIGFLKFVNYSHDTDTAILIFAGYGIASSIIQLSIGVFEAFEKMQYEAFVLTFEKVFITGVGIILLIKGYGLIYFCAVFLFGGFISIVVSWLILKHYFKFKWNREYVNNTAMCHIAKEAFPFGLSLLIASIYNYIGIFILSLMKSVEVVGWYSAAFKFISMTNVVPMILVAAVYPKLSRQVSTQPQMVSGAYSLGIKYLTFLALPMITGTFFLAEDIVILIFGNEYINSVKPLMILVWAAAFVFYNIYLTGILKAANYQKTMVKIQIIAVLVNIGLNVVLIYYFSFIGVAITTLVTELLILITYFRLVHKRVVQVERSAFFLKATFSALIMALIILLFRNLPIFGLIPICVLIYFSSLYLMKGFSFSEILPFIKSHK